MSEPKPAVDEQLEHLLGMVRQNRDEKCGKLLAEARDLASEIIRQARRQARLRMRDEISVLREEIRDQQRSANAQRWTRERQRRQGIDQEVLERAWEPLRKALIDRWNTADTRHLWIDTLVNTASASLTERQWLILHGPGWPEQERDDLRAKLGEALNHTPIFEERPLVAAGLRICAADTCVDGTVEGLLRDRIRIGSLMLGRFRATGGASQ